MIQAGCSTGSLGALVPDKPPRGKGGTGGFLFLLEAGYCHGTASWCRPRFRGSAQTLHSRAGMGTGALRPGWLTRPVGLSARQASLEASCCTGAPQTGSGEGTRPNNRFPLRPGSDSEQETYRASVDQATNMDSNTSSCIQENSAASRVGIPICHQALLDSQISAAGSKLGCGRLFRVPGRPYACALCSPPHSPDLRPVTRCRARLRTHWGSVARHCPQGSITQLGPGWLPRGAAFEPPIQSVSRNFLHSHTWEGSVLPGA